MYLLDISIVFELRKSRPNPKMVAWVHDIEDSHLHLCAVTIGEIQAGFEVTRAQNQTKMDAACFRRWAKLMHCQLSTVYEDAMIAATAIVHDLTVVTRNERDFSRFDVRLLNLFE